jgi:hypothetical protein
MAHEANHAQCSPAECALSQEARSVKWEPTRSVTLRQLANGEFAMYHLGGISAPFWIGPADELASAYASRPAPPARQRIALPQAPAKTVRGINLAGLDFNI